MLHLQRKVDMHMSRFENWKNSGIHWQPYYRYSYHISQMLRYQKKRRNYVFFFSTSSFVSNFVCFREIFAGFDFDKSYNYIQHFI